MWVGLVDTKYFLVRCTDDTPCRLGDGASMTFLHWFVPWTGPPVQLREVGPVRDIF